MGAYLVIQALDGNVLEPLLFSEAVDPHPIAIIVAVLVFGGLWGVWGIFFAIPLATLVKAVYNAWPREGAPIGYANCDDLRPHHVHLSRQRDGTAYAEIDCPNRGRFRTQRINGVRFNLPGDKRGQS